MQPSWIIFTGGYSCVITLQISLFFRRRAEANLRAEHREELDRLRKARDDDRQRTSFRSSPSLGLVPSSRLSPAASAAFEQGRLEAKVEIMAKDLECLNRRLVILEDSQQDDQRGAA